VELFYIGKLHMHEQEWGKREREKLSSFPGQVLFLQLQGLFVGGCFDKSHMCVRSIISIER
jgi:hypothetical protein